MTADNPTLAEPIWRDVRFRIEMTVSCGDCMAIPKVENAGKVLDEGGRRVQIMHNGVKVLADGYYGEWMTEIICRLRGHHEPQEEAVFHQVLNHVPSQATMIELGGFWAYYSLWFLHRHADTRHAIVVEPDPRHLEVGRTNALLNGRQIDFVHACAGTDSVASREFQSETSGTIKLPQVSVAKLLNDYDVDVVDLLHCDIQGAEVEILRSCLPLFAEKRIRFCVVSTHSHHISGDPLTHQRCLAIIKAAGGQILIEHDVHESFSGDGLISAYFGNDRLAWKAPPLTYNRYSTSLFRNPLFDLYDCISKKDA